VEEIDPDFKAGECPPEREGGTCARIDGWRVMAAGGLTQVVEDAHGEVAEAPQSLCGGCESKLLARACHSGAREAGGMAERDVGGGKRHSRLHGAEGGQRQGEDG